MAGKIQLDITTQAHLKGIEDSQAALAGLKRTGNELKNAVSTGDLDKVSASIMKNFHNTSMWKNELVAAKQATTAMASAMKMLTPEAGTGTLTYTGADGAKQQIKTVQELSKYFDSLQASVQGYAETYVQSMAKTGDIFSYDTFQGSVTKNAEAARLFGGELKALEVRMNMIAEQGTRMVQSGSQETDTIQRLSNEYNELSKQHAKLQKSQTGTGERIKNLVKNFVSAQLVVFAIRKAWQLLTQTIRESAQAASNAQETYNMYITTFKNLESVAQQTAATLSNQFGLANSSAQQSVAIFGDMAVGFGQNTSEALKFADTAARLVMDLMSFKNVTGDTTDIMQKFASGLAGNVENFRRYGIIVRATDVDRRLAEKGLDKLTGSALESAKMQERLNIAIEQSPNAVGDMIRTFNSAQNVQRRYAEETKRLKENIGTELLPIFTKVRLELMEHMRVYNLVSEAKRNFMSGTKTPQPLIDMESETGIEESKKSVRQFLDYLAGAHKGMQRLYYIDDIEQAARAFGVTGKWIQDNVLTRTGTELEQQINLLDQQLKKERELLTTREASANALVEYSQNMRNLVEDFSGAAKISSSLSSAISGTLQKGSNLTLANLSINDIIKQFAEKPLKEFTDPLTLAIGGTGGDKAALEERQKQLKAMFDVLNNARITAEGKGEVEQAKALALQIETIVGLYKQVVTQINKIDYDKQFLELQNITAQTALRLQLEQRFGKENDEIVSLYAQQAEEERKAWQLKVERSKETGNEAEAMAEYNRTMTEISKQYAFQIQALRDSASFTARQSLEAKRLENSWIRISQEMAKNLGIEAANDQLSAYIDYLKNVADSNKELAQSFGLIRDGVVQGIGNINLEGAGTGSPTMVRSGNAFAIIPKMVEGVLLDTDTAIKRYVQSGSHMGIFQIIQKEGESLEDATARTKKEAQAYMDGIEAFETARESMNDELRESYNLAIENIRSGVLSELTKGTKEGAQQRSVNAMALSLPFDASAQQTALAEMQKATALNQITINEYIKKLVSLEEIEDSIKTGKALEEYLDPEEIKKLNEYRTGLAMDAELEYQIALKNARDGSLATIQGMWEGLGDVGMVKDWIATFDNIFAYEKERGKTEEEASSIAMGRMGMMVILEFASHLESVNKIFSIFSAAFEAMAPVIDQFLAPIIAMLPIIIDSLNVFIPLLTMLFPIVKAVATAFVWLSTVTNWVAKVIEYAAGQITFWTSSDNIAWSEVQAVWDKGVQTTKDIWAMEIDARAEYIADLTDAQKGEIDAYKQMYRSGLINARQYEAMVNQNVYGRTTGLTSVSSLGNTGATVSFGNITIQVQGGGYDASELAQEISAELGKLTARGVL